MQHIGQLVGAHIPHSSLNKLKISHITHNSNLLKHTIENNQESPNNAKGYTTNDKDMNFKQPIASNQETKNWLSKDTQIKPSNPEFSQLGNQRNTI